MFGFFAHREIRHSNHDRAAFSLTEMVVVMGILVILLAVTIPAFRGLNQGGARRAAVSNLMGALDRARTMAVSDGKATYLAFYASRQPLAGTITDSDNGPWGRAYAIYQDTDNVNFVPVQRTPWIYLPPGISFKVDSAGAMTSVTNLLELFNVPANPDLSPEPGAPPQFPVTGSASLKNQHLYLPFLKFDATGALDETLVNRPANYLRVLMFVGLLKADGTEVGTQPGSAGATVASLEEIDLNPVTGRARYVVNSADNLVTPPPTSSPQS